MTASVTTKALPTASSQLEAQADGGSAVETQHGPRVARRHIDAGHIGEPHPRRDPGAETTIAARSSADSTRAGTCRL